MTDFAGSVDTIVVVPVYNEASRLDVAAFQAFVDANEWAALLFVDDGSSDRTRQLLDDLVAHGANRIAALHLAANRGKAEAVRAGLLDGLARGAPMVGFIDADLAAPLDAIAMLRRDLETHEQAWAAIGSRIKLLGRRIERSERRHYLGRVFATFASLAISLPVYDTQCGLKLFRNVPGIQTVLSEPFRSRWIFDVELLARIAREARGTVEERVRELPLERWEERGESRLRARDYARAPMELTRIWWRYRG